jgi:hypothetical protein
MLRIPKQLLDPELVSEYCLDEHLSFSTKGENIIVSFRMDDDEPEWTDGEGWLASLISLRKDLMQGDHRCLYLAWLCSLQGGDFEDAVLEPPVPAGLGNLTASLERLADFLCIDFDLIAAAAERSKSERDAMLSKDEITDWVANLPLEDKNAVLLGIEDDASHLAAEVRQRAFKGIHANRQAVSGSQSSNCRSARQILARAEAIGKERQRIKAERAAREKAKREREQGENRRKHLESLNGKEGDLWAKVNQLILTKQPKRYDEAVSILRDLHDLADKNGTSCAFSLRMENLYREHESKRTFVDRLRTARLLIPAPGRILAEEAMERDAIN